LLPLLLETSFQAQFLIPMAVSISFGLIAATGLTLVFVPAIYLVLGDVTGLFMASPENRIDAALKIPESEDIPNKEI